MSDHDDFVKKLNAEGEGTPRDIQPPTDDATFERQSRDAVKLYRLVVSTDLGLRGWSILKAPPVVLHASMLLT